MKIIEKKLNIIQEVSSRYYNTYKELFVIIEKEKIEWLKLSYADEFYNTLRNINDKIKNFDTWITYDKCVTMTLSRNGHLEIKCLDGDLSDGFPSKLRWSGTIILPIYHYQLFDDAINSKFHNKALDIWEQNEAAKKTLEIISIKKTLLNRK